MKIGLFIPCFMNELYPEASMDTLTILENLGLDVVYPMEQTCCGQAQANTGCSHEASVLAKRFLKFLKIMIMLLHQVEVVLLWCEKTMLNG